MKPVRRDQAAPWRVPADECLDARRSRRSRGRPPAGSGSANSPRWSPSLSSCSSPSSSPSSRGHVVVEELEAPTSRLPSPRTSRHPRGGAGLRSAPRRPGGGRPRCSRRH
jgi:hypothetical protein